MKKVLILTIVAFITLNCNSQNGFKWDITDSVAKTKEQIYSDTKMYIAKTWNSAKDVIQNDDKDGGVILVKGVIVKKVSFMMGEYQYVYSYSIIFKMKDKRFKLIIDDVNCDSAVFTKKGDSVTKIPPFEGENCPETGTMSKPGISKAKAITMMSSVKQDLQFIADSYIKSIKSESKPSDW